MGFKTKESTALTAVLLALPVSIVLLLTVEATELASRALLPLATVTTVGRAIDAKFLLLTPAIVGFARMVRLANPNLSRLLNVFVWVPGLVPTATSSLLLLARMVS
jgi:hypothetical protein